MMCAGACKQQASLRLTWAPCIPAGETSGLRCAWHAPCRRCEAIQPSSTARLLPSMHLAYFKKPSCSLRGVESLHGLESLAVLRQFKTESLIKQIVVLDTAMLAEGSSLPRTVAAGMLTHLKAVGCGSLVKAGTGSRARCSSSPLLLRPVVKPAADASPA